MITTEKLFEDSVKICCHAKLRPCRYIIIIRIMEITPCPVQQHQSFIFIYIYLNCPTQKVNEYANKSLV